MKTTVVDMDGVLCEETKPYSKAKPICGAKEFLDLREGKIIIHTSRRERDRDLTVKWLKKHGFRYDRLVMGKPKGDVYIDDKAVRFLGSWSFIP